ncbi:MAG: metallophosphoesterase family protein [Rhodospirillales bacterium]|jgi:serine/threonine protein phosphatase 1|nr:metallophosphoesterase family protein [Rhodospirillales bacterium]
MASTQQGGVDGRPPLSPAVPEGTRVYAVGDIHGRADLLHQIQDLIKADAASAPEARKLVVYLGDYVDRGPHSNQVVEHLIARPMAGFEAVHLKGNHEDFLIRFVADGAMSAAWMMNGGRATLVSYDVSALNLYFGERGHKWAQKRLARAIPQTHLDFYRGLAPTHVEGDYLFVHAGLRPGVALDEQTEGDMIWIRDAFLNDQTGFEKVVVHGHSIQNEPDVHAHRIGIDTGAYRSGRLTCLVLEGLTRRFLHT